MHPVSPYLPKRTLWKIHKGQDFHELNKLVRSMPQLTGEELSWKLKGLGGHSSTSALRMVSKNSRRLSTFFSSFFLLDHFGGK